MSVARWCCLAAVIGCGGDEARRSDGDATAETPPDSEETSGETGETSEIGGGVQVPGEGGARVVLERHAEGFEGKEQIRREEETEQARPKARTA